MKVRFSIFSFEKHSMLRNLLKRTVRSIPAPIVNTTKRLLPAGLRTSLQRFVSNFPDYLIMSHPKCGRTWLRLMIARACYNAFPPMPQNEDEYLDLGRLHSHSSVIPTMNLSHDDVQLNTPSELERDKRKYSNTKIVFLARDPRDVVVSWYFQTNERAKAGFDDMKSESPADYLVNERGGLKTLIEFFNIWADQRKVPREFMLLTYEELRAEPLAQMRKLFEFLGCSDAIPDNAITEAVEYNKFDKMKERERQGEYNHAAMKKFNSSENAFKTRRGKVGGYADYFSDEQITLLNDYVNQNLDPFFGYHHEGEKSSST